MKFPGIVGVEGGGIDDSIAEARKTDGILMEYRSS
jgi:hypothetical protein